MALPALFPTGACPKSDLLFSVVGIGISGSLLTHALVNVVTPSLERRLVDGFRDVGIV